ncbi:MAG: hypothetical protein ACT4TC_11865, partial [Myxococcaceae bacterium]
MPERITLENGSQWIFRYGYDGLGERKAYLTSRHLRTGVVPKTVLASVEGNVGSLQRVLSEQDR